MPGSKPQREQRVKASLGEGMDDRDASSKELDADGSEDSREGMRLAM